jgi:endonuclease G, mitochondrial
VALICFLASLSCFAQDDNDTDNSSIHHDCTSLKHFLNLFTIHGIPMYQKENDSVSILINHGYCLGFSKKYNEPIWAAYQVSRAKKFVDYERFPFFVDDRRLEKEHQIGSETFGNNFDRGHMVPNAAINKQFGKLSQMETFIMSNICPQKANLNQGVWQKLEAAILNTYPNKMGDTAHVWVLVGPVFHQNEDSIKFITRPNGVKVAIPESFFCILARPVRFPQDSPSSAQYLAFIFPQNLPKSQTISKFFLVSINKIEELTGINFFPSFSPAQQNNLETVKAGALW